MRHVGLLVIHEGRGRKTDRQACGTATVAISGAAAPRTTRRLAPWSEPRDLLRFRQGCKSRCVAVVCRRAGRWAGAAPRGQQQAFGEQARADAGGQRVSGPRLTVSGGTGGGVQIDRQHGAEADGRGDALSHPQNTAAHSRSLGRRMLKHLGLVGRDGEPSGDAGQQLRPGESLTQVGPGRAERGETGDADDGQGCGLSHGKVPSRQGGCAGPAPADARTAGGRRLHAESRVHHRSERDAHAAETTLTFTGADDIR